MHPPFILQEELLSAGFIYSTGIRKTWIDIYDAAKEKDTWVNEISSAQLIDAFDVQRLSEIHWISETTKINDYKNHFRIIARDILMAADNSLCKD